MVKNKDLSLTDLVLSIFKFKTFQRSFSYKLLIIYNLVLLLLIGIISLLSNNVENYSLFSDFGVFFFMLFGLPIVLLICYGLFYILFNAYEIKRKKFFESYLVFMTTLLPFVLFGNLLNLIDSYLLIPEITLLFGVIMFILLVYYFVVFVNSFKNYYQTDCFKIVSALIIVITLNVAIITLQYLSYLVSILA